MEATTRFPAILSIQPVNQKNFCYYVHTTKYKLAVILIFFIVIYFCIMNIIGEKTKHNVRLCQER